jgi:hypothetical protein
MDWVDGKIFAYEGRIEKPTRMIFDSEAQENSWAAIKSANKGSTSCSLVSSEL